MVENTGSIEALLQEDRTFPPPEAFRRQANVQDPAVYEQARRDPEAFWAGFAEELDWFQKWDQILDWKPPYAQWFLGGKLNVSYNCLDRHLTSARRNKAAFIWEGEPGDRRVYTYKDLHREVCQFANGLKSLGVKKGDRVTPLSAHDSRAAHRHAGLRSNRRAPQRRVRRLQRRVFAGPY